MIYLWRLLFGLVLLIVWQVVPPLLDAEFFVSTPSAIFGTLWRWMLDGRIWYHGGITASEAGLGFVFGGGAGMILGLALGRFPTLAEVLDPYLIALYSIPKAALAPLFILWFGIGMDMKVIMASAVVFFLVFLNTLTGVREVSREQITLLSLMGAGERHIMTKVIIPSAVVWVFAGLRLSVPYALIGAIVGEIIASNRGLGYLISSSAASFDTAGTFAALVAITALSVILSTTLKFSEKKLMPWRQSVGQREISI